MKNLKTFEGFWGNKMKHEDFYEEHEITPTKEVGPNVIQKFAVDIKIPRKYTQEIYKIAAENNVQISNIAGDDRHGLSIFFTGIEKNAEAFVHDISRNPISSTSRDVQFWSIPN